ncbi:hypothetical protein GIB67_023786 [Kingdonia uniflora]|uniref:Uncharacterized protein n=1 Tax=Kingdonia uniflora TaxID=39325 RepID=A0A7J7NFW0_9MAGN|nr:hypothetical protein GIB67_023786 [Kingdonia uniflora]
MMSLTSLSTSLYVSSFPRHHIYSAQQPRSNTRKSSKPTKKLSKLKPLKTPSTPFNTGGDATTYTRLPPRDDFSFDTPNTVFAELKLSDVAKQPLYTNTTTTSSSDSKEEEFFPYRNFEEISAFEYGNVGGDDDVDVDQVLDDGDKELEDLEEKEKGVPAVMRCFDRAKIYVKGGDGGNGVVAFRREKFVPYGGPSGGDGGRGGHVYFEVDASMNSLLPFRKNIHFRAGRGYHGQGSKMAGAKGEEVVVKVAPGTVIKDGKDGAVLMELLHPGQRALMLPGGRGGRGNASFKSGTNKVPKIAEKGEKGAEMWLELELKLVADVGIVGAPNAGKSTLLSAISAAQPTIANYPFTTLLPNLGVVSFDYDATMIVADLPGLLEGAHRGFGLGHEFLRHTERCSVLVHVVDGSGEQPECEFDAVRLELELFNPELSEKPFIVAYNKTDLLESSEKWISFKETLEARGIKPFSMSAMTRQGTREVISAAYELLSKRQKAEMGAEGYIFLTLLLYSSIVQRQRYLIRRIAGLMLRTTKPRAGRSPEAYMLPWQRSRALVDLPAGWTVPVNLNHVADMLQRQKNASINEFEISHDSSSCTWHVVGAGIQRFVQMTNWQYSESLRRFQHVLEACGVNKSLIKLGVKEGDRVVVGEMELVWHDSNTNIGPSNTRKDQEGSVKWPQWK